MPFVTVEWLAGRSHEQKRVVAQEITRAITAATDLNPQDIVVVFHDVPKEEWAVGGILPEPAAKEA